MTRLWKSLRRLLAAFLWTRGHIAGYYASAVRVGGFALGGWEIAIDGLQHPGVLTAAAGMIMFKNVIARKDDLR